MKVGIQPDLVQESLAVAWALGLTVQRRQRAAGFLRARSLAPFLSIHRGWRLVSTLLPHQAARGQLPWLSPRWIETQAPSQGEPVQPATVSGTSPISISTVEIHLHPCLLASLQISLALRQANPKTIRAPGLFNLLEAREARSSILNLNPLPSILNLNPQPFSNGEKAHRPLSRAEEMRKNMPKAVEFIQALPSRLSTTRQAGPAAAALPDSPGAYAPISPETSGGEGLPYPVKSAFEGLILSLPENGDRRQPYPPVAVPSSTRPLQWQAAPRISQVQPASALFQIFRVIQQTIKHEVKAAIQRQAVEHESAPRQGNTEPLPINQKLVSDDLARSLLEKIHSLAEEERFRQGYLR